MRQGEYYTGDYHQVKRGLRLLYARKGEAEAAAQDEANRTSKMVLVVRIVKIAVPRRDDDENMG